MRKAFVYTFFTPSQIPRDSLPLAMNQAIDNLPTGDFGLLFSLYPKDDLGKHQIKPTVTISPKSINKIGGLIKIKTHEDFPESENGFDDENVKIHTGRSSTEKQGSQSLNKSLDAIRERLEPYPKISYLPNYGIPYINPTMNNDLYRASNLSNKMEIENFGLSSRRKEISKISLLVSDETQSQDVKLSFSTDKQAN